MRSRSAASGTFCRGDKVYLRRVELRDAGLIAEWKSDPLVQRMALDPGVETSVDKEEEDIQRAREASDQLYLILVVTRTTQPIGYVRINWMDACHRFAWLRFAVGVHRGKGYAKEGLRVLLGHLFRAGAHRVDAEVYDLNQAGLRLLEGLGFGREGLKRQAHFDQDGYHNIVVLGLLAEDFCTVDAHAGAKGVAQ
jgi:ribosomal-protein-alanine N-acetyltransferase